MGVIVLEGIVVTLLVLVGLREAIMRAVPLSLKRAIGVGIGLFILFIGFIDAGMIVKTGGTSAENPVPVDVGVPDQPAQFLFWFGLAAHRRPVGAEGAGGAAHQHPRHDRSSPSSSAIQPLPTHVHRDAELLDARASST